MSEGLTPTFCIDTPGYGRRVVNNTLAQTCMSISIFITLLYNTRPKGVQGVFEANYGNIQNHSRPINAQVARLGSVATPRHSQPWTSPQIFSTSAVTKRFGTRSDRFLRILAAVFLDVSHNAHEHVSCASLIPPSHKRNEAHERNGGDGARFPKFLGVQNYGS